MEKHYMTKALGLAHRGLGKTSPNPLVGAVVVKEGKIIGEGYSHQCGGNHAEVNALQNAREDVREATIYITLEPCCHYERKVPPCIETVAKSGIKRAVLGTIDPSPSVNGKGVQTLNRLGVETKVGVLREECLRLNEVYFKYIQTGIPFVTLKFAQTLDGRIATTTGSSQWISSEPSLKVAHKLRSIHDAILVGIGTVLADNPRLTVRLVRGRSPTRVIVDSKLRTPLDSKVLQEQNLAPTIIATTPRPNEEKKVLLEKKGIEIVEVSKDEKGQVDLNDLLLKLGKRGITSVLVEGGSGIITSLLLKRLADKIVVAIAPKILGKGIEAVGALGILEIQKSLNLSFVKAYKRGSDLIIKGNLSKPAS
jgi:diaminohydroxyphosphoribosylaminopyrimidine deaminase/5-amino-6-(5-phosphoribosylamino)uracil reductase